MVAECTVNGCSKLAQARGWCPMHYQRWRLNGDLGPVSMIRQPNIGVCTVGDCGQPMRKRTWCASHYAQWTRMGEVRPFEYKWATRRCCVVCGATDWEGKGRKFCSGSCQQYHRRNGVPQNPLCARCDTPIPLNDRGKAGRRKRIDSKLCRKCKTMHSRYWMSPGEIALRDGTDCRLCGKTVDLTLFAPDIMRASVDHIVPRSWGGSDDPDNLQLAHLHCNHVKSDRYSGIGSRSSGKGDGRRGN